MDTGYVQLLDDDQKTSVLERTAAIARRRFVAGAFVADQPGAAFDLDGYLAACDAIASRGGTPVIFPSHGLNSLDDDGWVAALDGGRRAGRRFVGFELGCDVRAVRPDSVARRVRGDDEPSIRASVPSTRR